MKQLITLLVILVFGFGLASAKTDYKNPVKSDKVAELVLTTASNKTVNRDLFIAVDKYDNCFISINVNYFKNKGKDDLQVKVKGNDYRIKLAKSIKAKVKDYYVCPDPTSLKVTTRTTKIGNTYTTTSSINRDILGWYNFYSIYPISKELYNLIKDNGIEEVAVEGVAPIKLEYKQLWPNKLK